MDVDVVVIGAGHAGCEAGWAAAGMGATVCLLTINLDVIGQMSCNPAIGGLAKGHLVRELDALGGLMGQVIDRTGMQFRMLNRSRGPAVQAPRAQADKVAYRIEMRKALEDRPGLQVMQDEAVGIDVQADRIAGVRLQSGAVLRCRAVVVATGTFLGGRVFIGDRTYEAGRSNEPASMALCDTFRDFGFELRRLKTGTPPRLHRDSIDFSKMDRQDGDDHPVPFSFQTEEIKVDQVPCWLTSTTVETHAIIRENMSRSALFSGQIQGVGPRYCPSIEDKLRKFPDRERHQVFLEPESRYTAEYYANGISTSLPVDVQQAYVTSIPGLERARIVRPGYAIEYDSIDPTNLDSQLASKDIGGLYFAGQINGTSGYEEAAVQGYLAGVNAASYVMNEPPLVLKRDESYAGVLVDDLVTTGVDEPYRMFTSRAEHRLLLSHHTADQRLMRYGHERGLIPDGVFQAMTEKYASIDQYCEKAAQVSLKEVFDSLEWATSAGVDPGHVPTLEKLLRRPEISLDQLQMHLKPDWVPVYPEHVEIRIRYAGYVQREQARLERMRRWQEIRIPDGFSYDLPGLSREVREKLERVRPTTIDQASRVPGITPAALAIIQAWVEKSENKREK